MKNVREVSEKSKCRLCGTVDGNVSVYGIKLECTSNFHPDPVERKIVGGKMAELVFKKGGLRDRVRGMG